MHIAFIGLPLSGHVNPTLEVVRELVRRGHRVTYPAVSSHRAAVEDTGAAAPAYQTAMTMRLPERDQWMTHMCIAMVDETSAVLPQLRSIFASDPPDLVVHDRIAFWGRMLATLHGVPAVQVAPNFADNGHWAVTHKFAPIDTSTPEYALYQARLTALLAEHDVDWQDIPAPRRHVVFLPRAFQYAGETFGDEFHFVGPCLPKATGSWPPPGDGRPILLISMGSLNHEQPAFYRLCYSAFGGSRWHVVMAIGDRVPVASLGPMPANFEVMPFVPQLAVLARASLMLCHAGMGSTMEALHFGVPLVHVPLTPEQDANAARLAELKLGAVIDPARLSAAALRDAVDQVASDARIAQEVRWMRSQILAAGGAPAAATSIESALG